MRVTSLGNDGHIINGFLVNAGNPTTDVTGIGILDLAYAKLLSLQLIIASLTGAFTGNWKVEASNNWSPVSGGTSFGQIVNAGTWTDVTATFVNAAITVAITANGTQMTMAPAPGAAWRAIKVSVARTGGTSVIVDVWASVKG